MTTVTPTPASPKAPGTGGRPRTGRRTSAAHVVVALLAGLCLLSSVALLAGGWMLLVGTQSLRQDGFLTSDRIQLAAGGYAVATDVVDLTDADPLSAPEWLLGTTRLRVTNNDPSTPVFVGIGKADDVTGYLDGVQHSTLTEIADPATVYDEQAGGAPSTTPGDADVWLAKAEGTGTQTLIWPQSEGRWRVVLMNADGSTGVDADVDVGVEAPAVRDVGVWLMVASLPVAVLGVVLLVVGVRRPTRNGSRR